MKSNALTQFVFGKSDVIPEQLLSNIDVGQLTLELPDGTTRTFKGINPGPEVGIKVNNLSFFKKLVALGDIGLGKSYIDGDWESDNIVTLIQFGILNQRSLEKAVFGKKLFTSLYKLRHFLNRNTIKGSQKNIHEHYDLGNNFYKEWLDPTMSYSSGVFTEDNHSLIDSQTNKYQRIIKKLNIKPNDINLEIGCGWGGFIREAAKSHLSVKGVTISKEQYEYTKSLIDKTCPQSEVLYQDYREIGGKYDNIISIEMFEAIGKEYWSTYFRKIYDLLTPNGKALIQTITINDKDYKTYSKGTDFIQQYIFPGGFLPSPSQFKRASENHGFSVLEEFEFGLDYAETLRIWNLNFQKNWPHLEQMGFDRQFKRTWEFYLGYCEGGFRAKKISVYQFILQKN